MSTTDRHRPACSVPLRVNYHVTPAHRVLKVNDPRCPTFMGLVVCRLYNEGRPHSSLGPGISDGMAPVPMRRDHSIAPGSIVRRRKVLGGLRHEYWLENIAA